MCIRDSWKNNNWWAAKRKQPTKAIVAALLKDCLLYTSQAGAYVMRHKKGFGIALGLFLIVCLLLNTMSSCSMMAQSIGSMISGTTYPSDDPELVAVEANYAAKEAALQAEIDNIESSHPDYDEYRYDLDKMCIRDRWNRSRADLSTPGRF